jgi:hypothetical protein
MEAATRGAEATEGRRWADLGQLLYYNCLDLRSTIIVVCRFIHTYYFMLLELDSRRLSRYNGLTGPECRWLALSVCEHVDIPCQVQGCPTPIPDVS